MSGWRFFSCARCHAEVAICRSCDRGQRYCSSECSQAARKEKVRAAGRRFAHTPAGRAGNRRRVRAHREGLRLAGAPVSSSPAVKSARLPVVSEKGSARLVPAGKSDSVTHHGSSRPVAVRKSARPDRCRGPETVLRCAFCGRRLVREPENATASG